MKRAHIAGIAVLMFLGLSAEVRAVEHSKDTLATVRQLVDDKEALLVDVREKKEWDAGHVQGAVFLPLSELRDGVSDDEVMSLSKDKVVYIHCRSGARALVAGEILLKLGYDVRPLKPGYEDLISAGFSQKKD